MGVKANKRINDPLYGAAFLTPLEFRLLSTPAFLRLNGVKQLGLGALVYPSAGYTRFAHSIGVCHLTGLALDSIQKNSGTTLLESEIVITRLAALLHDIGHYPFSHTTEEVVKGMLGGGLLADGPSSETEESEFFPDHEDLGRYIVETDPQITAILRSEGIEPQSVFDRLNGNDASKLNLILSSDLDCDRLDYLRRTSLHAGLPYGGVDVNYLIDNLTLDDDGIPCVKAKALGPADHFLMSRSYDYAQLPFHKAVVGFEEALKKVISAMHKDGVLNLRRSYLTSMIDNGDWSHFDDQKLYEVMRRYKADIAGDHTRSDTDAYIRSIFERRAPKLVFSMEYISDGKEESTSEFHQLVAVVTKAASQIFSQFGIPDARWFLWEHTFRLMKGSESGQRIRIERTVDGKRVGIDIAQDAGTLTSQFDGTVKRHIRVYACLIDERDPKKLRDEMREALEKEVTQQNIIIRDSESVIQAEKPINVPTELRG